jgi:hypothetical protein
MKIDDIQKQRMSVNESAFRARHTKTRWTTRCTHSRLGLTFDLGSFGRRIGQGLALWLCRMSSSTFEPFHTISLSVYHITHTTMSEDPTRQPASPEKAFTSDQWKGAEPTHAVKPENANVYAAAASQHTAGGSAADVTITDAAKSIKLEDFASLPKKPCVRDSLLTGITAGFVVGSSRAIWRGMSMEPLVLVNRSR